MVITAYTYGPSGFDALTPAERMKWARSMDYNMPQWYAGGYYSTMYADMIKECDDAGVNSKAKGGADLFPNLNKDGRKALITVISYNDQGNPGIGGRVSLEVNKKMLPQCGKDLVVINRLTGRKQPLPETFLTVA